MNKEELKAAVCRAIDEAAADIEKLARKKWKLI